MTSLIDLRNILLAERQSGQLTEIPRNLSEEAQTALKEHRGRIFSASDPMSDETQIAIEEADGIDELIETIYSIRLNKIATLAITSEPQSNYEELRRMTPQERAVFDDIFARVNQYRAHLKIPKALMPAEKKQESITPVIPSVITPPVQPPPLPPQPAPVPAPKPPATMSKPPLPKPRPPLQKPITSPEPVKKEPSPSPPQVPKPAAQQPPPKTTSPQPAPQIPPKESMPKKEEPKKEPQKQPETPKPPTGKPPDKMVIISLQDIEPFVGADGRTYVLKQGAFEIVPRANAEALIAQGVAKISGTVTKKTEVT